MFLLFTQFMVKYIWWSWWWQ